jgi:Heterokaryon incompatibility protein (HET)
MQTLDRTPRTEQYDGSFANLVYKPLIHDDSIRLLVLEPGLAMQTIRCRFEYRRLSEEPPYEAISYVWGPALPTYRIILDRCIFVIRGNLYHGLCQLRHLRKNRTLWIDAICLNQDDIPERNHQVQQMKRIYESATGTLVWLGIPGRREREALKLLQLVEEAKRMTPGVDVTKMIADRLHPNSSSHLMSEAFSSFFSNTWFTRVWVQQEFAVSRNIQFVHGRISLASTTIRNAVDAVRSLFSNEFNLLNESIPPRELFVLRDRHQSRAPGRTLPGMLASKFGQLKASDPRDHIFSLLGLVEDAEYNLAVVDYKASVKDVFVEAMSQCLYYCPTGFFELLSLVSYLPQGEYRKSLPSWAPDFSASSGFRRSFSDKSIFSASKGSQAKFLVHESTLSIRGRVIGALETYLTNPSLYHFKDRQESQNWLGECQELAKQAGTFYDAVDFENLWWKVLVCDLYYVRSTRLFKAAHEGYGDYHLHPELLLQEYISQERCTLRNADFLEMQKAYELTRSVTSYPMNFCATDKGMLGWVPRTAKVGDKLCIFAGALAPFIIRDRHDGTWELIGDAYIHGIMYGETMEWEGIEWEDIKLT